MSSNGSIIYPQWYLDAELRRLRTPLINACDDNDEIAVRRLVANGANVNELDTYKTTALMGACLHGYVEIAQFLVDNGADIHISITSATIMWRSRKCW